MALVGVGACLFTAMGLEPLFASRTDPTRIAAQIVTGVGFLGAGAILRHGTDVRGLTTAATIWVVAATGMVIGFLRFGPSSNGTDVCIREQRRSPRTS